MKNISIFCRGNLGSFRWELSGFQKQACFAEIRNRIKDIQGIRGEPETHWLQC